MDIKSWLRTVLQHYQEPERTFRDVDAVLQMYLSLKPKMDTYTSNDGHTQLLLCLHGTVPITYRSIPYNIPVAFWIPKEYPKVAPIPYVKPTANMLIREGRHVDKSGMCYHHYRSSWSNDQKHTLLELVAILQQVFAQEPPVYTKPSSTPSAAISPAATGAATSSAVNSPQHLQTLQYDAQIDRLATQRQSMPSQPKVNVDSPAITHASPDISKAGVMEGTALYNMNQGLASLNLGNPQNISKSASLPVITSAPCPHLSPFSSTTRTGTSTLNKGNPTNMSSQEALYRKVTERLQQYNMAISGEMDKLLLENRQLNEGEMSIEQEYRALSDLRERLKYNNRVLEERSKEIEEVTAKVNAMPDVQVDEAICGTTVVANQLLELVADDNAISDTVYFLGKALNSERIDLATFMKYTRILSREQFMKRALIKKITQT